MPAMIFAFGVFGFAALCLLILWYTVRLSNAKKG